MSTRRRSILAVLSAAVLLGVLAGGNAGAESDTVKLDAHLSGANELPPTDPDGTGHAKLAIDLAAGQVCFDLHIRNTGTPNRGHIHVGGPTVNGGIVVPLFEVAQIPTDPRHDALEQGKLSDCVPGDPAVLAQIVADPGGYYVNLHNARFPGGAMRGQLG